MKKPVLIALTALFAGCVCCGFGLFSLLRPWQPPRTKLVGESLEGVLAIQVFPRAHSLIAWTTDGGLASTGNSKWSRKPEAKIRDVDVRSATCAVLLTNGKVLILNANTGGVKRTFQVEAPIDEFNSPSTLRLSKDGHRLALADRDQHLLQWDVETGKKLTDVLLRDVWRAGVREFDPSGKRILSLGEAGSGDTTTYVVGTDKADLAHVGVPRWLADGTILGAFEDDHLVRYDQNLHPLWSLNMGARIWATQPNPSGNLALVAMPGGGPWTGGRTSLVDLATGSELMNLDHPDQPMPELEWVGDLMIVGGSDGDIFVYGSTSHPIAALTGLGSSVRQLITTKDHLYAVDESGAILKWPIQRITSLVH